MIFVFFSFYVCVVFIMLLKIKTRKKIEMPILFVTCVVLIFMIGSRNYHWPDTEVYVASFIQSPSIFNIDANSTPIGYVEKGFFYLGCFIKTFVSNSRIYLIIMAAMSMSILYKVLGKYCILPLFGILDYIARFLLTRDMIQIRSSFAILLIIYSLYYVYSKEFYKYLIVILIAYTLHHMALIAIPFYFVNLIPLKKKHIIICLIVAFIISQLASGWISDYVDDWSEDLNYQAYTQGIYVEDSLGLKNPMIYMQLCILIYFMFSEKRMKRYTPYFVLFRNCYFYSTFILILFCNYTALSGRTSTMFATTEMFILPLLSFNFTQRSTKIVYFMGVGLVFLYFFYTKYTQIISQMI